ncbi:MAG: aminotransferase class III-fold pyridoxal phosphate-dependent enzyme, partial [Aeromonas sp.]|nr:aminotransferase class III-fold pyridoxal phosphate-dependent enzyme [Aeromonas sp.]
MTNQEFDLHHVWHPYTSLTHPLPCYEVASAKGVTLTLSDGRELVDGMSSWWACVHGYQVPELDAAATAQLGKMSHVMFGGLTHAPAVELCRKLVEITPAGLDRVFLADSGSVAVEVALKMA